MCVRENAFGYLDAPAGGVERPQLLTSIAEPQSVHDRAERVCDTAAGLATYEHEAVTQDTATTQQEVEQDEAGDGVVAVVLVPPLQPRVGAALAIDVLHNGHK